MTDALIGLLSAFLVVDLIFWAASLSAEWTFYGLSVGVDERRAAARNVFYALFFGWIVFPLFCLIGPPLGLIYLVDIGSKKVIKGSRAARQLYRDATWTPPTDGSLSISSSTEGQLSRVEHGHLSIDATPPPRCYPIPIPPPHGTGIQPPRRILEFDVSNMDLEEAEALLRHYQARGPRDRGP